MDKCLKRGIGSSSWVLKLIILMAFLVFLLIFSMLASGAVPQLRRLYSMWELINVKYSDRRTDLGT